MKTKSVYTKTYDLMAKRKLYSVVKILLLSSTNFVTVCFLHKVTTMTHEIDFIIICNIIIIVANSFKAEKLYFLAG